MPDEKPQKPVAWKLFRRVATDRREDVGQRWQTYYVTIHNLPGWRFAFQTYLSYDKEKQLFLNNADYQKLLKLGRWANEILGAVETISKGEITYG